MIIGGTGVFGKRLVRHLSARRDVALVVSSRDPAKAELLVQGLQDSAAPLHPIALDCAVNLDERLDELKPHVVVDCSGPFQRATYDTARAVLRKGAHFVDLADARDYLAGFAQALDTLARTHGVAALTGASSTPALSTGVARQLTRGWARVDTIDISITPGGKSEVGRSVIDAVMSYAGKDIPVWRSGRLARTTGWRGGHVIDIPTLGRRRVAAVETFDAEHLGSLLTVQSRVAFFAGLEFRIEQYGIEAIAALRKRGLINNVRPLVPWLLKARRITRILASDVGGMRVEISGLDAQRVPCRARWSLIARRDHGPFVPILPAAAAVDALIAGRVPAGAQLAHHAVSLRDILDQARGYPVTTATSQTQIEAGAFERALGATVFKALPKEVSRFHDPSGPPVWEGRADVTGGRWIVPRVLARVFGFPKAGRQVPVTVTIDRDTSTDGVPVERWTRCFAGRQMTSLLRAETTGLLSERFGPLTFDIPVRPRPGGLEMPVSGWRIGRWKLPRLLAPQAAARESTDDQGRFHFDVHLRAPMIGTIVRYRGWLVPLQRSPHPA